MAESFENLDDILPDWANEDLEKSLAEAVDSYVKQEEERKSRFSVENDLTKLLEQSQSNATKRNTKWVVKLFQGKKPLLCFEFNELNKQKLSENDLFETKFFSQCQNNCLHRLVSGKKHHNTTSYNEHNGIRPKPGKILCGSQNKKGRRVQSFSSSRFSQFH